MKVHPRLLVAPETARGRRRFHHIALYLARLRQAGKLPSLREFFESPTGYSDLASAIDSLQRLLPNQAFWHLNTERRFFQLFAAESINRRAIRSVWPKSAGGLNRLEEHLAPRPGCPVGFLDSQLVLRDRDGSVVSLGEDNYDIIDGLCRRVYRFKEAGDEQIARIPLQNNDESLLERIFRSVQFDQLLYRFGATWNNVTGIELQWNRRTAGGNKLCMKMTIYFDCRPSINIALRMVGSFEKFQSKSFIKEASLNRRFAKQPVLERFMPHYYGSTHILIYDDYDRCIAPYMLMIYFGEWLEGETLVEMIESNRPLAEKLAYFAVAKYLLAVNYDDRFLAVDPLAHNVMLRYSSPADSPEKVKVRFFDLGGSFDSAAEAMLVIYADYVLDKGLLPGPALVGLFSVVGFFRRRLNKTDIAAVHEAGWTRDVAAAKREVLALLTTD